MNSLFLKQGPLMPVSMNQDLWPLDSHEQYRENVGKNGWENIDIWSILSPPLHTPPPHLHKLRISHIEHLYSSQKTHFMAKSLQVIFTTQNRKKFL